MFANSQTEHISIKVGRQIIEFGRPALLVAEIGGNHGGDRVLAGKMLAAAAAGGAGAVKFQAYRTSHFVSPRSPFYAELAAEELSFAALADLAGQGRDLGLAVGLTVFDQAGLELAADCRADFIKISSGDLTNHFLLGLAAESGQPLFVSTGASNEDELAEALELLAPARERLVLLQCASLYPAPPETANLALVARWLGEGLAAGYSDHTLGLDASKMALSLGALVLEKHFTIDRTLPGGDNLISALPDELAELARWSELVVSLWGSGRKAPHRQEEALRPLIRRVQSAARDLPAGHRLEPDDLILLRPSSAGNFLEPKHASACHGRVLARSLSRGEALAWGDLESDCG